MQRSKSASSNRCHAARTGRWVAISISICVSLWLGMNLASCGGGSNVQGPPPPASFTIVATPSSPSIAPGTSSTFQVSITPSNGFSGAVAITISGLPSGLTVAPSSFSVQNTPQTVTLTASSTIVNGNYSLTLNGSSGSVTGSATVSVGVEALANFLIIQPLISQVVARFGSSTQTQLSTESQGLGISNYLLNFSVTGLPSGITANFSPNPIPVGGTTTLSMTAPAGAQWTQGTLFNVVATPTASVPSNNLTLDLVVAPPPGSIPNNQTSYLRTDDTPRSIVYDAAHQQIFSSDYFLDRVDVVSTATRQLVKSIPVLSPSGLALTIDGSQVLVGSDTQQVQAISTSSLQIVNHWLLTPISGSTYGIQTPFPLADGTVAFRPSGYSVLSGELGIWNPANNSTSLIYMPGNLGNIACYVAAGPKSTIVLIASCSEPGVALLYNTATGTFSAPLHFPGFVLNVASSPDGSQFIISDDTYGVGLYNSQLQATSFLIPPDPYSTFIYSSDGSRIYLQIGILGVFDSSGNFIREAPTLGTIPPGAQIGPCPDVETPFAVDSTGIIFGSADHGIAFDDSTYAVNTLFGYGGFTCLALTLTPSSGPVNTATPTAFPQVEGFGSLPDVWFGALRAMQASLSSGPAGNLSATAPASPQAGPVDVKLITPDGQQSYNPLDFSYGPSLMFVNGDTASPAGGSVAFVTGLGLPTDSSQVQLTVGGQSADIVSAKIAFYYGISWPYAYPYPAVEMQVTLPPGSGDQDLVVTTSSGSSTLSKAIHYSQSVKDYASPDAFQSILLDRSRNQLYISAGDHIDVFSLTTSQFLIPFKPPSLNGQANFHGLALTTGNSLLLAADFPDGSVALINPDQPNSATAVQIIPPGTNPGIENVVTTNTGNALIESKTTQSAGCGGPIYELNLSSLQVTTINNVGGFCIQPEGFPMAASADGSKIVLATTDISGGQDVTIYDVASNKWLTNSALENFGGNAAVSANGTAIVTGSSLLDSKADVLGSLAWQEVFQSPGPSFSLPLEKIPDGGSLVYMPRASSTAFNITRPSCVDIFDVNHGTLLHRLNLTEEIQQVTDAMAVDANGQNIYLITNAGLTIVQLNVAPLSIGSVTPKSVSPGAKITISGSGFQSTTAVNINGASVTPTFVNVNTLQVTVPSLNSGAAQVTVTNPSGDTYSLDNAFTVQ